MSKVVALYARTSSDEQAEKQTILTQLEYARDRAKAEHWKLREFIDDGVSGKKKPLDKRPAGAALLEAIARGEISRVVVYKVDRLGRRTAFILNALRSFEEAGVEFQSLKESYDSSQPIGRLLVTVLSGMAEFESDTITQRTSDGRARVAKIDHRWLGGLPPFGYTVGEDKILAINLSEAAAVRKIFAFCSEDDLGAQRIADALNARGIPYVSTGPRRAERHSKQAAPWHAKAVNDILRNELYVGRASYYKRATTKGREIVFRRSPAIVSQAVFGAAQAAIDRRATWGSSHTKHDYLLRGLVLCGRDGRHLIGRKWYGRGDGRGHNNRPIYYCEHCPAGERPIIDERELLAILWADTLDFLEHPDDGLRAIADATTEAGAAEENAENAIVAIAEEIREIEAQESRLVDLVTKDLIAPGALEKKASELRAARERAEQRLGNARAARVTAVRADAETAAMKRVLTGLRRKVVQFGKDERGRAQIVQTVTKQIVVYRGAVRPRLVITYAFGAGVRSASAAPASSAPSLAIGTASSAG